MNKFSVFVLVFVLTGCAVATPPIKVTQVSHIITVTATPQATTSSPTPTLSPMPPTPTLPGSLRSLRIVYTGGFSIYLWQGGKVTVPVEKSYHLPCMPDDCNQVLLSDDSQLIAYTTQVIDYELSVVSKDGSNQKLLVDFNELPGTTYLYEMGWLPNTHLIWFTTIDQNIYHSFDFSNDLYFVNADTGELRKVLPAGEGGDIYPSPDGNYLAIVRPESIEIRKKDGRKIPIHLDFEFMYITDLPTVYPPYPIPMWADDSSALVVAILSPDAATNIPAKLNIWKLLITATAPELVAQPVVTLDMHMSLPASAQPLSKAQAELYPVSISPDLSWFIYSHKNQEGTIELHLAKLDLTSDAIVHSGEAGYEYIVQWLPGSREFFIIQRDKEHWMGRYFLGNIEGQAEPFPLNEDVIYRMNWIDDNSYLYVNRAFDLRLGIRGEPESILIEEGFSPPYDTYDFLY